MSSLVDFVIPDSNSCTVVTGDVSLCGGLACTIGAESRSIHRVEVRTPMCPQVLSVRDFIAGELSLVPEVELVFVSRKDRQFHVWTVVDAFERSVREKIYAHEREIIDEFDSIDFDFNIISRRGRPLDEATVKLNSETDLAFRR